MKSKNLIFSTLLVAVFSITALFFNSCEKKETSQLSSLDQKYSKNIEVFDKSGKNSIILKVSSDDKSIVDLYSIDNFQLIINPEPFVAEVTEDKGEDLADYSDENAISITMGVIEERFKDDVVEYKIEKTQPTEFQDMRANFTKEHYYSTRDGFIIERTSTNRRVYVWTKSCNSNCGTGDIDIEYGWNSLGYNNYPLSNNEKIREEACGSTYIGAVVKAKKHNGKYTHGFYTPTCNN